VGRAAEIDVPGQSTKEQFATCLLGAMGEGEIKAILPAQRIFEEDAKKELDACLHRAQVAEEEC
jgi:hypothetical protein